MPKSIRHVTKVIEVAAVSFEGELVFHHTPESGYWAIKTTNSLNGSTQYESLEEWLEKFEGKRVTITIDAGGYDESHLLDNAVEVTPSASL